MLFGETVAVYCEFHTEHTELELEFLRPTVSQSTSSSGLRLCSLYFASYDSQRLRWKYSNPPPHGV
jgi:hypothetical protein